MTLAVDASVRIIVIIVIIIIIIIAICVSFDQLVVRRSDEEFRRIPVSPLSRGPVFSS